jgi:hypothetical protein
MTVAELIVSLQAMPQNAIVTFDGFDENEMGAETMEVTNVDHWLGGRKYPEMVFLWSDQQK